MNILAIFKRRVDGKQVPEHIRLGTLGEREAKKYLQRQGMKFLATNFRTDRGEIDLVFRDRIRPTAPPLGRTRLLGKLSSLLSFRQTCTDCLVFIEVKTRSSEEWVRPAAAVDKERRGRLTRAGLDYLRLLRNPPVKVRFDIVEVLLQDGQVREIRHLPNSFAMERPYRYG
jgi:putative endonuclease